VIILCAVVAVAAVLALIGRLLPRKASRATAVVIKEENLVFDKAQTSFTDDLGNQIRIHPGEETQWRIYYAINDFPDVAQGRSEELLESEKDRAAKGHLRFVWGTGGDRGPFSSVHSGDKLTVEYEQIGGNGIQVLSLEPAQAAAQ